MPCTCTAASPGQDAPILILDEATSSLDAENERLVQASTAFLAAGPHCGWHHACCRRRTASGELVWMVAHMHALPHSHAPTPAAHALAPQAAIDKLMEGRTVMVIAHRLSTVQTADQVGGGAVGCGAAAGQEYAQSVVKHAS